MEKQRSFSGSSVSRTFQAFAENECKGHSPFYYTLSKQIAGDIELIRIASFVKKGQPVPNAFLAAVHYLVLKNNSAPLAGYYPSIRGGKPDPLPFELFKAFVLEQEENIIEIIKTRSVQTNVLTRCNYLLPVLTKLINDADEEVTLVDIGTSAGLNLNFDHYEYYVNNKKIYGDSPVKLQCEIKDGEIPIVQKIKKQVHKIGIDQDPVDLTNAEDLLWLQALVWPDQEERFTQLHEALHDPHLAEIRLIKGSTLQHFQKIINAVHPSHTLVVTATHVLYQFTKELLEDFYRFLDDLGKSRNFYFLSAEATKAVQEKYGTDHTAVVLTSYKNRLKQEVWVAETNGHGNWIRWK